MLLGQRSPCERSASLHGQGHPQRSSLHCLHAFREGKLQATRRRIVIREAIPAAAPVSLAQSELLQLVQPHPILAFSNPFPAISNPFAGAVKTPPNFLDNLASKPVETISQLPSSGFHVEAPSLVGVLGFLLANPIISLVLAISLYILVPRIWRALVKFVFIPAGLVGAGIVVIKNPGFFSTAGSTIAGFSTDHPYITSAAILGTIAIVLSPYVLTALVLLLVFTGVPNLPAPIRGFLPAPFLEVEESIRSADSVIRGPVEQAKKKAFKAGDDFRERSFDFLGKQLQVEPEAAELPYKR